jgi:hypothetical protein
MLWQLMARSNFLAALAMASALALPGGGTTAEALDAADVSKARIEGAVVDEAGRPVEGATVRAPDWDTEGDRGTVRTRRDGRFRLVLDAPLASYRQVLASSDGGARQGLAHTDALDFRATVDLRVVLKPCREVTVQVVDDRKKPVPGAFVVVLISTTRPLAGAETDRAGAARFRLPADLRVDQVVALKAGVGFDYYENRRSRSSREWPPLPPEVTLVLDGARTAVVQASDSAGRPVPDVPVVPWTIKKKGKFDEVNLSGCAALPPLAPRTDARGIATLDWLPRDLTSGVTFLAESEGYFQPGNPYLDPAQKDARLTTQLFRKVPAGGKVSLPDGRPAGGILLQAEGRGTTNMYFRGYARTAADGSYRFQLYPDQTYIVAVIEPEWAAPSRVGIQVREDQPVKGLDFRLGKGTLLEGRATVGPEKKPMARQVINLIEQGPDTKAQLVRWAYTEADGRYRVRLGRGTFQLSGPDYERRELVVHDEPRIERDFALPRLPRGPLRGRVVTRADRRPVAGATVQAESADPSGRGGFEAVSDEHGRFTVERWRARAWVYARSADGRLASFAALTADDEEVEVPLWPAATLAGRLVGKDGKPLPGVRLICQMEVGPKEARAGSVRLWAQADREGRFVLGGMVPGSRCTLSAYTGNTGSNELKEVDVTGAREVKLGDLVFDLQP